MKKIILTTLVTVVVLMNSCKKHSKEEAIEQTPNTSNPTSNPLDGSAFYTGPIPYLGPVSFMNDNQLVTDTAYPGQIILFFNISVNEASATSIITAQGGTILSKAPVVGYYLVGTPVGTESNFIAAMQSNPSVYLALPNVAASYMSSGINVIDNCPGTHGQDVQATLTDCGGTISNCHDDDDGYGRPDLDQTLEYIWSSVSLTGNNSLINISTSGGLNGKDYTVQEDTTKIWAENNWKEVLTIFLTSISQMNANLRANLVVTLCAGNGNMPLTGLLAEIRTDPKLADVLKNNVLLVGANTSVYEGANDAPDDPDFANMTSASAPNGAMGTSFAAPRAMCTIQKVIDQEGLTAKDALRVVKLAVATNPNHELILAEVLSLAADINGGNEIWFGSLTGTSNTTYVPTGCPGLFDENCTVLLKFPTGSNYNVGLVDKLNGTGYCQGTGTFSGVESIITQSTDQSFCQLIPTTVSNVPLFAVNVNSGSPGTIVLNSSGTLITCRVLFVSQNDTQDVPVSSLELTCNSIANNLVTGTWVTTGSGSSSGNDANGNFTLTKY